MGIYEVILACASITLFGTGLRFCLTCLLPIRGQIEEQIENDFPDPVVC